MMIRLYAYVDDINGNAFIVLIFFYFTMEHSELRICKECMLELCVYSDTYYTFPVLLHLCL